ncbi:hypothetical protein GY45DRAFT_168788 [Cubamyces sp. BRFM 1775]|nr:hypothetical protein GY45DRAFT_168788 [Cubamyces sp. BRFM 1775]
MKPPSVTSTLTLSQQWTYPQRSLKEYTTTTQLTRASIGLSRRGICHARSHRTIPSHHIQEILSHSPSRYVPPRITCCGTQVCENTACRPRLPTIAASAPRTRATRQLSHGPGTRTVYCTPRLIWDQDSRLMSSLVFAVKARKAWPYVAPFAAVGAVVALRRPSEGGTGQVLPTTVGFDPAAFYSHTNSCGRSTSDVRPSTWMPGFMG